MYTIHNISIFIIDFRENQMHVDIQNNNILRFSLNYLVIFQIFSERSLTYALEI